jgi:hypothetical protein
MLESGQTDKQGGRQADEKTGELRDGQASRHRDRAGDKQTNRLTS